MTTRRFVLKYGSRVSRLDGPYNVSRKITLPYAFAFTVLAVASVGLVSPVLSAPLQTKGDAQAMLGTDTYTNFAALTDHEQEGVAYRIRAQSRVGIAIMAPHGGHIEPGTSEIAEAVAGTNFAFYAFEGLLSSNNRRLHITSTRFDEPGALRIATNAALVVTLHGEGSTNDVVYIGGRDEALRAKIAVRLRKEGFDVQVHPRRDLQGLSRDNLCNRGKSGAGVQLELSAGLRRACFRSPYPSDLSQPSDRFAALVEALRSVLQPAL